MWHYRIWHTKQFQKPFLVRLISQRRNTFPTQCNYTVCLIKRHIPNLWDVINDVMHHGRASIINFHYTQCITHMNLHTVAFYTLFNIFIPYFDVLSIYIYI